MALSDFAVFLALYFLLSCSNSELVAHTHHTMHFGIGSLISGRIGNRRLHIFDMATELNRRMMRFWTLLLQQDPSLPSVKYTLF